MGMLSNLVAAIKKGLRGGKVRQDGDGYSKVPEAEVASFHAMSDNPHAQFTYVSKPRRLPDGTSYTISSDMALNPTRYGFADKATVQQWFADNEMAK